MNEMKWFDMWYEDKASILDTMVRNMVSDLDAGYDPTGYCIRKQKVQIESYENEFCRQTEMLKCMDEKKAERWCYIDMKKRGVIA